MRTKASSRIELKEKPFGELEVGDWFQIPVKSGGQFFNGKLASLQKTEPGFCDANAQAPYPYCGGYTVADDDKVLVIEVEQINLKPLAVQMFSDIINHVADSD